jgi:hypothetical protein
VLRLRPDQLNQLVDNRIGGYEMPLLPQRDRGELHVKDPHYVAWQYQHG